MSTPRSEYTRELVNMRGGDIFMGAFNAEQVMYNHFGYRDADSQSLHRGFRGPSAAAPFQADPSYIAAGIIARDLGVKLWWVPANASDALGALAAAA